MSRERQDTFFIGCDDSMYGTLRGNQTFDVQGQTIHDIKRLGSSGIPEVKSVTFVGHSARNIIGQGHELSSLSAKELATKIAANYRGNKANLENFYCLSCEAGFSSGAGQPFAQQLQQELFTLGFQNLKVHAFAPPHLTPPAKGMIVSTTRTGVSAYSYRSNKDMQADVRANRRIQTLETEIDAIMQEPHKKGAQPKDEQANKKQRKNAKQEEIKSLKRQQHNLRVYVAYNANYKEVLDAGHNTFAHNQTRVPMSEECAVAISWLVAELEERRPNAATDDTVLYAIQETIKSLQTSPAATKDEILTRFTTKIPLLERVLPKKFNDVKEQLAAHIDAPSASHQAEHNTRSYFEMFTDFFTRFLFNYCFKEDPPKEYQEKLRKVNVALADHDNRKLRFNQLIEPLQTRLANDYSSCLETRNTLRARLTGAGDNLSKQINILKRQIEHAETQEKISFEQNKIADIKSGKSTSRFKSDKSRISKHTTELESQQAKLRQLEKMLPEAQRITISDLAAKRQELSSLEQQVNDNNTQAKENTRRIVRLQEGNNSLNSINSENAPEVIGNLECLQLVSSEESKQLLQELREIDLAAANQELSTATSDLQADLLDRVDAYIDTHERTDSTHVQKIEVMLAMRSYLKAANPEDKKRTWNAFLGTTERSTEWKKSQATSEVVTSVRLAEKLAATDPDLEQDDSSQHSRGHGIS